MTIFKEKTNIAVSCFLIYTCSSSYKSLALSEHGSCKEQVRRKAGARAVQTGNETALNELAPIGKNSCVYREKHLCQYAKCLVPIGKISEHSEAWSSNHRGYIVGT